MGIATLLFQANWQALPLKLQKYFVVMITNAQTPLYYHGFGVAVLNLETFTKVIAVEIADFLFPESFSFLIRFFVTDRTIFRIFFQLIRAVITYYMMFKTLASAD